MSDEEDKYIKQAESDQIARIRRERQLAALRKEEREGIANILGTDEDVANEAMELGFDRATARVLHLVPLIQIAWADGTIQSDEREAVLQAAHDHGVQRGSAAYEFLELLLEQRPSDLFFERTNRVIAHVLANDVEGREADDLLTRARSVARSAGGVFGFGSVSKEEQKLIDELAIMFDAK